MSQLKCLNPIILNEGREKSLQRHHPWIFSKAIAKVLGDYEKGATVTVLDSQNNFLCYGLYSPESQIRVRALSFDESVKIDDNLIKSRIENAILMRKRVFDRGNDGVRLVSSEGDLLPGLIVDKYNEYLVISISSCGMERFYKTIVKTLQSNFKDGSF